MGGVLQCWASKTSTEPACTGLVLGFSMNVVVLVITGSTCFALPFSMFWTRRVQNMPDGRAKQVHSVMARTTAIMGIAKTTPVHAGFASVLGPRKCSTSPRRPKHALNQHAQAWFRGSHSPRPSHMPLFCPAFWPVLGVPGTTFQRFWEFIYVTVPPVTVPLCAAESDSGECCASSPHQRNYEL